MTRIAMVVNIPAPYRVPVYDRIAERCGSDFRVIYMAALEANRKWKVPPLRHDHVFLRGFAVKRKNRDDIHLRWGVHRELSAFRPDVVVTAGFNPPMIAAWLHAKARRLRHVPMSDGWTHTEAELSAIHRVARRAIYATSSAFVGASAKTLALYETYGMRRLFKSPLGVDNKRFAEAARPLAARPCDLVFAGNLIDRKLPLFFAEVVARIAQRRGRASALVIGDGALRGELERALAQPGVEAVFTGFLQQAELPAAYARGKIFCFPTRSDPWGVVANEACASGMPVITCANAGCADELVVHGRNGYVLDLDADAWADHAQRQLDDPALLAEAGEASTRAVQDYTFAAAADGILAACRAS